MNNLPEATQRALEIPANILALDELQMRRLGYEVVDRVIKHLTTLGDQRALTTGNLDALTAQLGGPIPHQGSPISENLATLADIALANQQHGDHPRYFARVPGPSSYPAILGEWLATGMQSVASSWGGGSGPSTLETITCGWLRDGLGLAPSCEGVLLSGGSMANITAVITARAHQGQGIIYLSDQTHSSINRGLLAIGQPAEHIRTLATDETFRINPLELQAAVRTDIENELHPMLVIATAGTTNTGAVDDLPAIAKLCDSFNMWLHVDGAYGGPAALCARGRSAIPGLEHADSFVTDPHKWLFQPYDIACLFVKTPGALERTFAMYPEYLKDVAGGAVEMQNRSLELTRRSRAVKLWLTFRSYGLETLAAAVERGIGLAEYAQYLVEQDKRLEIVTPAALGIVTFAGVDANADDHVRAAAQLNEDGYAAVSSTVLKGRTVLRLCTINPSTSTGDIGGTLARLAHFLTQN
ncbi:MAG: aminotransferase class I/II-fold pyridoxal phosphate-dependent enzyme [Candidatus Nanopelagicales bacterium]|nr:aminotransferase class I/II-fold pyridoxal phosphate-dependent enzyme [Candidatus Nanopelagicales bacterium]